MHIGRLPNVFEKGPVTVKMPIYTEANTPTISPVHFLCSLQTKIAQTRYWPVEIMRMPMPSAAKPKGKVSADIPNIHH